MRTRELGSGGPSVAVVGCGDVSLPRAAARGLDSSEVRRAVSAAIELGLGLVDTADDVDSLRLVGDAVRAQRARDRVVVATRVPARAPAIGAPLRRTGSDALAQALPVAHVVEQVDAALRASKLDAIGLAQLPLAPELRDGSAWPELVGTCAGLVRDGKVLRWGAIVEAPGDAAAAERLVDGDWLASVQVTFCACARDAGPLIDRLAARKVAVLARRVLAGGALGGMLGPGARLTLRDDRGGLDQATLDRIALGAAELAALVRHEPAVARATEAARARLATVRERRPAGDLPSSLAELALRYAIDRAGVTCALVRLDRHAHVIDALAACGAAPLPDEIRDRLDRAEI